MTVLDAVQSCGCDFLKDGLIVLFRCFGENSNHKGKWAQAKFKSYNEKEAKKGLGFMVRLILTSNQT